MFTVKQYDEVFVKYKKYFFQTTALGFYCYGMKSPHGLFPFKARSFYSCAYNNDMRFIIVKKKWHYYPAALIDNLRQLWYKVW